MLEVMLYNLKMIIINTYHIDIRIPSYVSIEKMIKYFYYVLTFQQYIV